MLLGLVVVFGYAMTYSGIASMQGKSVSTLGAFTGKILTPKAAGQAAGTLTTSVIGAYGDPHGPPMGRRKP